MLTGIALIQSVWVSRLDLWGGRPDLMLLAVMVWAMVRSPEEGLVWGFVGGLLVDLLSGGPLGGMALALVVAAVATGQPWGQGIGSSTVRSILLALLGTAAFHLTLLIVLAWTGHTIDWGFSLGRVAGPSILLNALLTPFVHLPLGRLAQRLRREGLTL